MFTGPAPTDTPATSVNSRHSCWSFSPFPSLYFIVYKQAPFESVRTVLPKLQAIVNTDIEFPDTSHPHVVDVALVYVCQKLWKLAGSRQSYGKG